MEQENTRIKKSKTGRYKLTTSLGEMKEET